MCLEYGGFVVSNQCFFIQKALGLGVVELKPGHSLMQSISLIFACLALVELQVQPTASVWG